MTTIDEIITDAKERVRDCRILIDEDKMKILRLEQLIQRNEGVIEGTLEMVDALKRGEVE
jgi:hypothetical protein